ncbi:unnamed protein product [Chrysoparadoxa australica]
MEELKDAMASGNFQLIKACLTKHPDLDISAKAWEAELFGTPIQVSPLMAAVSWDPRGPYGNNRPVEDQFRHPLHALLEARRGKVSQEDLTYLMELTAASKVLGFDPVGAVKAMVDYGLDVSPPAAFLEGALQAGNIRSGLILFEAGADPGKGNINETSSYEDEWEWEAQRPGRTMLHEAAMQGKADLVKRLMHCGAEVWRRDRCGDTAAEVCKRCVSLDQGQQRALIELLSSTKTPE